ncbi:hypothetical protein CHLRE_09g387652v5 [Chlamydomonas reinhardtii]|uniref:Glycosyl transferase CAP10 domain-containing protein n=1 Tax=Chlamydomonas reinhardtii TaxID=3055 RepID=A0A2K3DDX1_CHLRE|nr:uncharacterized protein CHLRE_09g387652v5 [Chlamydomonas reinhardtii]PNW78714.1 hypothetical protein CHLRE_09g387652v5 [Chlamydomonas reinhardtii]
MDWVLSGFTKYPLRSKGVGVAFVDGTPHLITPPALFNTVGHHKRLITGYLELMLQLSKTFGDQIPDVEFIVTTGDEPSTLLHHYANGSDPERLPAVLRFCKSDRSHADILVPDVHFHMRNFTSNLLSHADDFTSEWPWEKKQPVLFGRFSPYKRAVSMRAPELFRSGKNGKNICKTAGPDLWFCDVRKHFIWEWARGANRSGLPVDVAQQPKRDMSYHASNKWLLHLDGQTCSSRLEQLLVLGSLVLKEESGYRAFFHHLIKPHEHYLPFWKTSPEEAADAINWAKENDGKASEMAAAAQAVAKRYLHNKAIMCYWLTLLQEMSKLQRYRTGPDAGDRKYPTWVPVADYMDKEGREELAKHHMSAMEFWT